MRALFATLLCLGACQLSPSAFCDLRGSGEARCQERLNSVSAETFKGTCGTADGGRAADGACPREDRVGGCDLGKQGDGSTLHDWYYPPETRETVLQHCAVADAGFLEP
jgi:hypothetical protein